MRVRAVHKSEIFALAMLIFAMGLEAAPPSNAASDNTNHVPLKKVAGYSHAGPSSPLRLPEP
jgi:hypothetical protein